MDGGPNDVNLKNSTHIPGISIHYIPKDVPTRPNGRVPIVEIEEILLFAVVGLMLRTDSEDACYEHIPLVKSGEDNQRIQLKNVDWGAFSHVVHDCSTFVSADISQAKNDELLIAVYFTQMYSYSLSFHMTTFVHFLLYENPTNCSFRGISITEMHHL